MEPGPLPPHERTWRHPSELGPTRLDVDTGGHSSVIALAAGAMAVVAVLAIVVVMTPRPASGPLAISATTTPFVRTPVAASAGPSTASMASSATEPASRPTAMRSTSSVLLTSFATYPHAITAAPQHDLDGTGVASEPPRGNDQVLVRTDDVTYRLQWSQVPILHLPDGTVVFDLDGDLVAHVSGGELLNLADD